MTKYCVVVFTSKGPVYSLVRGVSREEAGEAAMTLARSIEAAGDAEFVDVGSSGEVHLVRAGTVHSVSVVRVSILPKDVQMNRAKMLKEGV